MPPAGKRLFATPLVWDNRGRSGIFALALLGLQASCGGCTALLTSDGPAWDRVMFQSLAYPWLALTVAAFAYGVYLVGGGTRRLRVAGVLACLTSALFSPWNLSRFRDWLRPGGEVTLENWREHRELHRAAAFADEVDYHPERFQARKRRWSCPGSNVPRFKEIKLDGSGRLRCYAEGAEEIVDSSLARYYDDRGTLRFVWQHGNDRRTFLDAHGNVLWAWEKGSYGLGAVRPAQLQPALAAAAQREFERSEDGCHEL